MIRRLIILLLIVGCGTEPEDCAGVSGGTAILDDCGVCDSNLANDCIQDGCGVWGGDGITEGEVLLWGKCYNIENTDSLSLNYSGLIGNISPDIGNLSNLTYLNLNDNQFSSAIPEEIGNLTSLTELYIARSELIGEIPTNIGLLTNLTSLHLGHNQLSGSIPSEIGNLTNLTALRLYHNKLTGEIPQEICNIDGSIYLDHNQLCPPYPECFGFTTSLFLEQDTSNCP